MNCLSQRKRFKNKDPVWSDPNDTEEAKKIQQLKDADEKAQQQDDGSESSSDDDDNEMYANDVRSKKFTLQSQDLFFKHLTDINNDRSYNGAVKQVQFHPKIKLALVSLSHGEADLFEVDGERNRYIQNIKLPKTRQPFCQFKPDSETVVISSESYRGSFFTYDMTTATINSHSLKIGKEIRIITDFVIFGNFMACRKEGNQEVIVLSSKTYEIVCSLKINESVKVVKFTTDNNLIIAGESGRIYIWDLRNATICKHRFQDEGSVQTTSMDLSETSKMLSIGSGSGIVNSYELNDCFNNKFPTPFKTFSNLKTSVDTLKYNGTGELLLIGSEAEPGAFRMVHSHSCIVYRNFPVSGKKYGTLLSADFSPLSGYLALGCTSGKANLCRIPYYKSY